MAGRWNFADAFARSLENQQKVALEKEQGARQQQQLDLQSKQVDQSHSHEMVMESIAKTEAEARATDAKQRLLVEGEQLIQAKRAADNQQRVADIAFQKAADEGRPLRVSDLPAAMHDFYKPYAQADGTIKASDYQTAQANYKEFVDQQGKLAYRNYIASMTPTALKKEDLQRFTDQSKALSEIYGTETPGVKSTATKAGKPVPGFVSLLNTLAPGLGHFAAIAKEAGVVKTVENLGGAVGEMSLTGEGAKPAVIPASVARRYESLIRVSEKAIGQKTFIGSDVQSTVQQEMAALSDLNPQEGTQAADFLKRFSFIAKRGGAADAAKKQEAFDQYFMKALGGKEGGAAFNDSRGLPVK